jgi:hypothetical protein
MAEYLDIEEIEKEEYQYKENEPPQEVVSTKVGAPKKP